MGKSIFLCQDYRLTLDTEDPLSWVLNPLHIRSTEYVVTCSSALQHVLWAGCAKHCQSILSPIWHSLGLVNNVKNPNSIRIAKQSAIVESLCCAPEMAANASDVEHGRSAHPRRTRQKPWFLKETAINWWIQIAAMFLDFAFGVTAIVVAILFGVFTILAWVAGRNTVKQAQIANQISLLSFCVSTKVSIHPRSQFLVAKLCRRVVRASLPARAFLRM